MISPLIVASLRLAREKRLCLYANTPSSANGALAGNGSSATVPNGNSRAFEATVVRIWSGDQISVIEKDASKERRVQFSSTRCPR